MLYLNSLNRAAIIDKFNGHLVQPLSYFIFGTICGTFGSLVDSILVRLRASVNPFILCQINH